MPVKIVYGFEKDKRPDLNINPLCDRFTIPLMIKVKFICEKTGKVLFVYAPKLEEEQLFENVFSLIKAYDSPRKLIHNLVSKYELKSEVVNDE